MKHLSLILLALFALIGCTENLNNVGTDEELVPIKLKVSGELTETQSPLARSSTSALYGIQVYVSDDNDGLGEERVIYGVFNDLSDITIMLPKNKRFDIEMGYMPNGQNDIHYHQSMDCWELPFNTFGWGPSPMNTVVYSKNEYLYGLGLGHATPAGDGSNRENSYHNPFDRYYGCCYDYTPVENGVVTIDLKRVVFGLTFKAKKVEDKHYDKILIQLDANATLGQNPKNYYIDVDQNAEVSELIIPYISLWGVRESVINDSYLEEIILGIGTDAKPGEIFYGKIKVKRNTMHTYEFDAIDEDSYSNGIQANIDNKPMEDSELITE